MALQRTNQELSTSLAERSNAEARAATAAANALQAERDALRDELRKAEARVAELQAECARALATADSANLQQQHYKVKHVKLYHSNYYFIFLKRINRSITATGSTFMFALAADV